MTPAGLTLHEAFVQVKTSKRPLIHHLSAIIGLCAIMALAVLLPIPEGFLSGVLGAYRPLYWIVKISFLGIKAFFLVEAMSYLFHRYFEHLGVLTRLSAYIRQNQQYHWTHHMIIYPLNKQYKKGDLYIPVKREGLPLYWMLPAAIVLGLSLLTMGVSAEAVIFASLAGAFMMIVDLTHDRFHFNGHPWEKNSYFQYVADMHMLHHFDQETNFSIISPTMDILFGTYLSPKGRMEKIYDYLKTNNLNTSDFINWHYLLTEATPLEYAAFVSALEKFPGLIHKLEEIDAFLSQISPLDLHQEETTALKDKVSQLITLGKQLHEEQLPTDSLKN